MFKTVECPYGGRLGVILYLPTDFACRLSENNLLDISAVMKSLLLITLYLHVCIQL